jgi:hypothetical protein
LLVNSLTIKHAAYEHEREVRLFIVGEIATLAPSVSTRTRGSDSVPFIKSDMPLQRPGSIAEIVVGPSAPPDAEEFVCATQAIPRQAGKHRAQIGNTLPRLLGPKHKI